MINSRGEVTPGAGSRGGGGGGGGAWIQLVLLDVHVTLTATVVLYVRGHVWLPLVQVHVVHDSPEIVGAAKSMWLVSPHWYCGG